MDVVTESDFRHAMEVLRDFMDMEPKFIEFLRNDDNWEVEGDDEEGNKVVREISPKRKSAECCNGDYV